MQEFNKPSLDDADFKRGGIIKRAGGKGQIAHLIVPHLAKGTIYLEPCFGAGGLFFHIPNGTYKREAINDKDKSIITFFKVLRDRPQELSHVISLTPYARDEFEICLEHSEDELEEARRVWVRSRQGFQGIAKRVGNWARSSTLEAAWTPGVCQTRLQELIIYANRLTNVSIDNIDCIDFISKWSKHEDIVIYLDPPYVDSEWSNDDRTYDHKMTDEDHISLSIKLFESQVKFNTKIGISGYPSDLYADLYKSWRCVQYDVPLTGKASRGGIERRTECLWMNYPKEQEIAPSNWPAISV